MAPRLLNHSRRRFRWVPSALCVAAAVAVFTLTRGAAAAEPTAAEIAVARRLFTEATQLEDRGKWAEAADKLRQAVAIKETPGLRYHLAFAEEQLGQLVEALANYDRATELLQQGIPAPDVSKLIGPARDRVRNRVPTLTVTFPSDLQDAVLRIDTRPVASEVVKKPIPLNPGTHHVTVEAPGRGDFRAEVTLVEGDHKRLEAVLPPERAVEATPRWAPPATAAAQPPVPAEHTTRPAGADISTADSKDGDTLRKVVLVGELALTAAGLGVGIGYTLSKSAAQDRITDAQAAVDARVQPDEPGGGCGSDVPVSQRPSACEDLSEAVDDARRANDLAIIGFVAAGVGATAAVVTFLVWPSSEAQGTSRPSVRMRGRTTRGGALVAVEGTF